MSKRHLPKPSVRVGNGPHWEASDVRSILCNPVHVGIGPFKQIIPEALWLQAAEKQISEQGAEQYLVNMLFMLKESFQNVKVHPPRDISIVADSIIATGVGPFPALVSDEQWIHTAVPKLQQEGANSFLRSVLQNIRDVLHT